MEFFYSKIVSLSLLHGASTYVGPAAARGDDASQMNMKLTSLLEYLRNRFKSEMTELTVSTEISPAMVEKRLLTLPLPPPPPGLAVVGVAVIVSISAHVFVHFSAYAHALNSLPAARFENASSVA